MLKRMFSCFLVFLALFKLNAFSQELDSGNVKVIILSQCFAKTKKCYNEYFVLYKDTLFREILNLDRIDFYCTRLIFANIDTNINVRVKRSIKNNTKVLRRILKGYKNSNNNNNPFFISSDNSFVLIDIMELSSTFYLINCPEAKNIYRSKLLNVNSNYNGIFFLNSDYNSIQKITPDYKLIYRILSLYQRDS